MKPLDEFSCVYIHKPRQPATGDPFPRSSSGQGVHERTPTPVRANLRLVVLLPAPQLAGLGVHGKPVTVPWTTVHPLFADLSVCCTLCLRITQPVTRTSIIHSICTNALSFREAPMVQRQRRRPLHD